MDTLLEPERVRKVEDPARCESGAAKSLKCEAAVCKQGTNRSPARNSETLAGVKVPEKDNCNTAASFVAPEKERGLKR